MKHLKICGLDEAGRGALAGPLVAAAVTLPCRRNTISRHAGFSLKDGKKLTPRQRQKIVSVLKKLNAFMYVEIISARSINNHGIGWANREIFRRLIKKIESDRYIVDGNLKLGRFRGKNGRVTTLINADATVPEVICAGIVAKVVRDDIMKKLHDEFPQFDWKHNAGYGTAYHMHTIRHSSVTRYHRGIFVTSALSRIKESCIRVSKPPASGFR